MDWRSARVSYRRRGGGVGCGARGCSARKKCTCTHVGDLLFVLRAMGGGLDPRLRFVGIVLPMNAALQSPSPDSFHSATDESILLMLVWTHLQYFMTSLIFFFFVRLTRTTPGVAWVLQKNVY